MLTSRKDVTSYKIAARGIINGSTLIPLLVLSCGQDSLERIRIWVKRLPPGLHVDRTCLKGRRSHASHNLKPFRCARDSAADGLHKGLYASLAWVVHAACADQELPVTVCSNLSCPSAVISTSESLLSYRIHGCPVPVELIVKSAYVVLGNRNLHQVPVKKKSFTSLAE